MLHFVQYNALVTETYRGYQTALISYFGLTQWAHNRQCIRVAAEKFVVGNLGRRRRYCCLRCKRLPVSRGALIWLEVKIVSLACRRKTHVLFHEIFRDPLGVPPGAVRFEVVLPWPPLHLAICTRDTDEPFQSSFSRGLVVSSRFVVTVAIVFSRETNILFHTFGMTALERFGVFSLMFAADGQHQRFAQ